MDSILHDTWIWVTEKRSEKEEEEEEEIRDRKVNSAVKNKTRKWRRKRELASERERNLIKKKKWNVWQEGGDYIEKGENAWHD